MLLDAIVLAGGRSSRLSGVPKAQLLWRGATLLQNTVGAALDAGARRTVVVGPADGLASGVEDGSAGGLVRVLFAREEPPFGGPAAAIAAGMRVLEQAGPGADSADAVLVLACDMPEIGSAVTELLASWPALTAAEKVPTQGAILLDPSGMRQPLAAIYSRPALAGAVAGLRASGTLDGASMRALTSTLELLERPAPPGSTRDVDTWSDAAEFGIERPTGEPLADARRSRS
jgi:molybdopterin-guanine dinucleotide biosynthesis protein A